MVRGRTRFVRAGPSTHAHARTIARDEEELASPTRAREPEHGTKPLAPAVGLPSACQTELTCPIIGATKLEVREVFVYVFVRLPFSVMFSQSFLRLVILDLAYLSPPSSTERRKDLRRTQ